jgi:hypothetical protein
MSRSRIMSGIEPATSTDNDRATSLDMHTHEVVVRDGKYKCSVCGHEHILADDQTLVDDRHVIRRSILCGSNVTVKKVGIRDRCPVCYSTLLITLDPRGSVRYGNARSGVANGAKVHSRRPKCCSKCLKPTSKPILEHYGMCPECHFLAKEFEAMADKVKAATRRQAQRLTYWVVKDSWSWYPHLKGLAVYVDKYTAKKLDKAWMNLHSGVSLSISDIANLEMVIETDQDKMAKIVFEYTSVSYPGFYGVWWQVGEGSGHHGASLRMPIELEDVPLAEAYIKSTRVFKHFSHEGHARLLGVSVEDIGAVAAEMFRLSLKSIDEVIEASTSKVFVTDKYRIINDEGLPISLYRTLKDFSTDRVLLPDNKLPRTRWMPKVVRDFDSDQAGGTVTVVTRLTSYKPSEYVSVKTREYTVDTYKPSEYVSIKTGKYTVDTSESAIFEEETVTVVTPGAFRIGTPRKEVMKVLGKNGKTKKVAFRYSGTDRDVPGGHWKGIKSIPSLNDEVEVISIYRLPVDAWSEIHPEAVLVDPLTAEQMAANRRFRVPVRHPSRPVYGSGETFHELGVSREAEMREFIPEYRGHVTSSGDLDKFGHFYPWFGKSPDDTIYYYVGIKNKFPSSTNLIFLALSTDPYRDPYGCLDLPFHGGFYPEGGRISKVISISTHPDVTTNNRLAKLIHDAEAEPSGLLQRVMELQFKSHGPDESKFKNVSPAPDERPAEGMPKRIKVRGSPLAGQFAMCNECGDHLVYDSEGFYCCRSCGLIDGDRLEDDPEDEVTIDLADDETIPSMEEWDEGGSVGFASGFAVPDDPGNTNASSSVLDRLNSSMNAAIASWRNSKGLPPEDMKLVQGRVFPDHPKSRYVYGTRIAQAKDANVRTLGYVLRYPGSTAKEIGKSLGVSQREMTRTLKAIDCMNVVECSNGRKEWYPACIYSTQNYPDEHILPELYRTVKVTWRWF